jgi:membrane associated rhomboid family serine protease
MFLPIGDDNSDRLSVPLLTWLLVAINVFVFVFFQILGEAPAVTYAYATVPQEILTGRDVVTGQGTFRDPISRRLYMLPGLARTPIPVYLTLVTAMFLHGGFAHITGNMLYLLIFGDNVEDRMGRLRFFIFYLLCGVIAGLAQVFATLASGGDLLTPTIGASGGVSGVLGAYLVLFPRKRIRVIALRFLFTHVSAVVAIGVWFLFQLVSGLGLFGGGTQAGGVAYAAHVGGFVAGLVLVRLFTPRGRPAGR